MSRQVRRGLSAAATIRGHSSNSIWDLLTVSISSQSAVGSFCLSKGSSAKPCPKADCKDCCITNSQWMRREGLRRKIIIRDMQKHTKNTIVSEALVFACLVAKCATRRVGACVEQQGRISRAASFKWHLPRGTVMTLRMFRRCRSYNWTILEIFC